MSRNASVKIARARQAERNEKPMKPATDKCEKIPPWHRTKIVCTLGPATDSPGVLERLIGAGMDVARINASHGTHADHARRIQEVRRTARQRGQPVAVLIDLPGPKFRVGDLPGGARELKPGETVFLAANNEAPSVLPVRHRQLLRALHVGESVYLADGSIKLQITTRAADRVGCEVVIGGMVRSGSGINVPESKLAALVPTEADRRHIEFAQSVQAEWLGVSFVQCVDDLKRVRRLLRDGSSPLLVAKIEKRQALADLDAIVAAADGVMVARGDLGVETDLAEIPLLQKRIIAAANTQGRPVITATQMLESMVAHEQPTRAEVTDIANAVLDGTDAVMLSGETAIGRFPVAAAEILQRVLTATETEFAARLGRERLLASELVSADDPLSVATCQLAARLHAKAIIVLDCNLATVRAICRFRPQAPVLVVSESARLCRQLAVVWGALPLLVPARATRRTRLALARRWLSEQRMAHPNDAVVTLSANTTDKPETLQVIRLSRDKP